MGKKAVFWDFDGTLVNPNESFVWALGEALNEYGYTVDEDTIRTFLNGVYSWKNTHIDYVDRTGDKWWEDLFVHVRMFCIANGVAVTDLDAVCCKFRNEVVGRKYQIYDDAEETLAFCKKKGYENYVLSNNYPELVNVIERMGLSAYFKEIFVSGCIGYEKPRLELFSYALERAGHPEVCYMVGDNPVADIQGGNAAGMRTAFVHKDEPSEANWNFSTLSALKSVLE